jgi:hypothetical protein
MTALGLRDGVLAERQLRTPPGVGPQASSIRLCRARIWSSSEAAPLRCRSRLDQAPAHMGRALMRDEAESDALARVSNAPGELTRWRGGGRRERVTPPTSAMTSRAMKRPMPGTRERPGGARVALRAGLDLLLDRSVPVEVCDQGEQALEPAAAGPGAGRCLTGAIGDGAKKPCRMRAPSWRRNCWFTSARPRTTHVSREAQVTPGTCRRSAKSLGSTLPGLEGM